MNTFDSLRLWWKRRNMWRHRTTWTWPRGKSNDPVVQAVRRWKTLPSMEKPNGC